MFIPPVQLPPVPTAVSQPQAVANTLPQVLTQAVMPIGQDAVQPPPKAERSQKAKERWKRDRGDEQKRQAKPEEKDDDRGVSLNISV